MLFLVFGLTTGAPSSPSPTHFCPAHARASRQSITSRIANLLSSVPLSTSSVAPVAACRAERSFIGFIPLSYLPIFGHIVPTQALFVEWTGKETRSVFCTCLCSVFFGVFCTFEAPLEAVPSVELFLSTKTNPFFSSSCCHKVKPNRSERACGAQSWYSPALHAR
jgi:hypothetical protein